MSIDSPSSSTPLSLPTENADDLVAMNEPDLLANEQTWPTEEEMAGMQVHPDGAADAAAASLSSGPNEKKAKKVVKPGAEGHQASWLIAVEGDDDDEDDDEDGDDGDGDGMEEDDELDVANGFGRAGGEVEMEEEMESGRGDGHEDLDDEEEERQ
jgi:pre-rRNA-processing protein TSR1